MLKLTLSVNSAFIYVRKLLKDYPFPLYSSTKNASFQSERLRMCMESKGDHNYYQGMRPFQFQKQKCVNLQI